MKRLLALILVLAMVFAFASCTLFGGDGNDKDNDTSKDDVSNDDDGTNSGLPSGGIDLPLVDIDPDSIG